MHDYKLFRIPLPIGTGILLDIFFLRLNVILRMSNVPYASIVGILMYAIIFTMLDITQEMIFLSRIMSNLGREHWNYVKMVLKNVCVVLLVIV